LYFALTRFLAASSLRSLVTLLGGIELAIARYLVIQDLLKDLTAGWFEHLCIYIIVVAS
jgi:hypothetical protein